MIVRLLVIIFLLLSAKAGWSQKPQMHCGAELVQQQFRKLNTHFDAVFYESTKQSRLYATQIEGTCTVQVVVHILKGPGDAFISNSRIQLEIDRLNRAINHLNADTANIREDFNIITGEPANIFFQLATLDPVGNLTSGIIRVDTDIDGFGTISDILAESAKIAAFGGSDPWDQSRYLNIWVCNTADANGSPIVAGYATPPAGLPNWPPFNPSALIDGVLIQTEFFGALNPESQKVVTHEVGHYLGLRHIWGDDIECFGDDGIEDTPAMFDNSSFQCIQQNTCVDNIFGTDLPDMYENYMDYSFPDCQVSFTNEQASFMRWVVENVRNELCQNINSVSVTNIHHNKLTLLPNPATESIRIQSDVVLNYSLLDASGRCLETGEGMNPQIDLLKYPSGVYFIQCDYNRKKVTRKFIKIPMQ